MKSQGHTKASKMNECTAFNECLPNIVHTVPVANVVVQLLVERNQKIRGLTKTSLGTMEIYIKCHSNRSNCCQVISHKTYNVKPHGGARGNVRWSSKLLGFIIWQLRMSHCTKSSSNPSSICQDVVWTEIVDQPYLPINQSILPSLEACSWTGLKSMLLLPSKTRSNIELLLRC